MQLMPAKDPNDVLDYSIDWAVWLDGDTIVSSDWSVPSGLTEISTSNSTTAATVWLSGGTAGITYQVTNQIVTAAGRTKEDSIRIPVKDN